MAPSHTRPWTTRMHVKLGGYTGDDDNRDLQDIHIHICIIMHDDFMVRTSICFSLMYQVQWGGATHQEGSQDLTYAHTRRREDEGSRVGTNRMKNKLAMHIAGQDQNLVTCPGGSVEVEKTRP